jgi:hypothetical protein
MTNDGTLGTSLIGIDNPFDVPLAADRVFPPQYGIPGYNETAFFTSWNHDAGVGIFIHVGRCPQDIDLWYAQVLALLPNNVIAVDRSWGRSSSADLIQTGNLTLSFGELIGFWNARFDGAAELTTAEKMSRQPAGSGKARPMSFQFSAEPAGPIWDMYAGKNVTIQDWAKGTHTQQILRIEGSLTVDGQTYCLDGYAGNDHSTGVRDLQSFASHHFLIGALPGCALHCISVYDTDGKPLIETGALFEKNGAFSKAWLVDVPPLTHLTQCEKSITVTLQKETGEHESFQLSPLHSFPLALTEDKDNINGLDWFEPDHLALTEMRVRVLRLSNGDVGYANLERSIKRSMLMPQLST